MRINLVFQTQVKITGTRFSPNTRYLVYQPRLTDAMNGQADELVAIFGHDASIIKCKGFSFCHEFIKFFQSHGIFKLVMQNLHGGKILSASCSTCP